MLTANNFVYGNQNVQVPAHLNFGKFILDRLRLKSGETALEHGVTHEKLTYKEFTQMAVNISVALTKLGVQKGDVVAVGLENRNEFVPSILGIVFAGATYTPHGIKSGRATLQHKISITQPKYFIVSNQFWNIYSDLLKSFNCIKTFITLDDAADSLVPLSELVTNDADITKFEPLQVEGQSDLACILYSSGTTGMPKGVQLTHLNCILNSLSDDFSDESLKTGFVFGLWFHNYDMFMTYKLLCLGRKIVYVTQGSPEIFLKCVQDCHIITPNFKSVSVSGKAYFLITDSQVYEEVMSLYTEEETNDVVNIGFVVPSLVSFLSKTDGIENLNLDSLKIIYSRSSPLHQKTLQKVKQRFPKLKSILQGYGMTEAGELTSESWSHKGPKPGSVGRPSPGIILKVVDIETREMLGPNQRGEICLKGPVLMKGYIGVDPSTYMDEQGFLKTGDLGYYDEDEYFYIVERLKEIITYDGEKIAPLELETILQLHQGVREAGVVGKAVDFFREEPTAFVVKQPGVDVTEQELIDFVAAEVPPYMQLKGGVKFIPEMPRNPRGKIVRQRLREMLN